MYIFRINMFKTSLSLSLRPYSTQPLPSISQIKAEFSKLKGGTVDLAKEDSGLAKLVLNYPSNCNALTGSMMVELEEAVTELEAWNQGRGLLVLGARNKGNYFCAGGHLETGRGDFVDRFIIAQQVRIFFYNKQKV